MESKRIPLETMTGFCVPVDELKRLYICMALSRYLYIKNPDYDEKKLLKTLDNDFKKFISKSQKLYEKYPDDLIISRIYSFFTDHHKHLSKIIEKEKVE